MAERREPVQTLLQDSEDRFKVLFDGSPIAVSYHEMIYDKNGKSYDYIFLGTNDTFQKMMGINPAGKTVRQIFPGIEHESFNWIQKYGEVAKHGETIHFQHKLDLTGKWYDVVAYQYKLNHFVTVFTEIAEDDKISTAAFIAETLKTVSDLAIDVKSTAHAAADHIVATTKVGNETTWSAINQLQQSSAQNTIQHTEILDKLAVNARDINTILNVQVNGRHGLQNSLQDIYNMAAASYKATESIRTTQSLKQALHQYLADSDFGKWLTSKPIKIITATILTFILLSVLHGFGIIPEPMMLFKTAFEYVVKLI